MAEDLDSIEAFIGQQLPKRSSDRHVKQKQPITVRFVLHQKSDTESISIVSYASDASTLSN